jgi:hypothetical protein
MIIINFMVPLVILLWHFAQHFLSRVINIKNLGFINFLIEKYNIKGIIYIILVFIMFISLCSLLPYQFYKYKLNPIKFLDFGDFC